MFMHLIYDLTSLVGVLVLFDFTLLIDIYFINFNSKYEILQEIILVIY